MVTKKEIANTKLFTTQQVADHFSVHRVTIYNWLKRGMPFQEVGPYRRKRFALEEVEEWFKIFRQ